MTRLIGMYIFSLAFYVFESLCFFDVLLISSDSVNQMKTEECHKILSFDFFSFIIISSPFDESIADTV